jgi:hypothetical protein
MPMVCMLHDLDEYLQGYGWKIRKDGIYRVGYEKQR